MHAPPIWLPLALCVATAVAIWWAIFEPKRRLSLRSLIVLVTLLAVAFAIGAAWMAGLRSEPLIVE